MQFTSFGAAREVTGSMHLLETGKDRILLDCGLFQGKRKQTIEKNQAFPLDPASLTNMVLSHAHIDHSGRVPLLVKQGFSGRIITTRITTDACDFLLRDSAHIQESDANYLNYKKVRGHLYNLIHAKTGELTHRERKKISKSLKLDEFKLNPQAIGRLLEKYQLEGVTPLYTAAHARAALAAFDGYPYNTPVTIGKGMTLTFFDAGHILGSAMCLLTFRDRGKKTNVLYTGDMGRFNRPILNNPNLKFPKDIGPIDLMLMESTYGARDHDPTEDIRTALARVITDTHDRQGVVVIPAFAFGRTQDLVYLIHELYDRNQVPKLPVFVDSPLASNLTRVFAEHPEAFDKATHESFLEKGRRPFEFPHLTYIDSVEASMACTRSKTPHIIISSSGMCEAGRILHHLRYRIHNPANTILMVGYCAGHTLGRRILDKGLSKKTKETPRLKILGKEYPLHARVVRIGGLSAHADRNEMLTFLKKSRLQVKRIAIVHGEEDQSLAFKDFLHQNGFNAFVPRPGTPYFSH